MRSGTTHWFVAVNLPTFYISRSSQLILIFFSTERQKTLLLSLFFIRVLLTLAIAQQKRGKISEVTRLQNSPYFSVFKYARKSNKRSGTRLKTESETGERC